MPRKSTCLITEHLAEEARLWLAERCSVIEHSHRDPAFPGALREADALIVRTYTRVDEALLESAPKLKVVARAGVGLDNIDLAACARHGVPVVYTPEANTQAVVEYTFMLLCDAIRPRTLVTGAMDPAQWESLRATVPQGRQLNEMTVGILGFGRIGSRLAKALTAIGANVMYHDLLDIAPRNRHGANPASSATELFGASDAISVHIDNRASNRHFVNESLLSLLKPNAIFLNTSRGFVVDHAALARALRERPAALAMLDVHDPEPFPESYPLLGLPNAKLYPHLAARTSTAMLNMSWVVRDVVAVLEGRQPEYQAR